MSQNVIYVKYVHMPLLQFINDETYDTGFALSFHLVVLVVLYVTVLVIRTVSKKTLHSTVGNHELDINITKAQKRDEKDISLDNEDSTKYNIREPEDLFLIWKLKLSSSSRDA